MTMLKNQRECNAAETGRHSVGDGLTLLVMADGKKYWIYRYQLDGKRKEKSLGSFKKLTLKQARAKKAEFILGAGAGGTSAKANSDSETFEFCVEKFLRQYSSGWSMKTMKTWASSLEDHCQNIWKMPIDEIEISHIQGLLNPIWNQPLGRVMVQRISKVFSFSITLGYRKEKYNPAQWKDGLEHLMPANNHQTEPRFAVELEKVSGLYNSFMVDDNRAQALKLLMLSAVRVENICAMEWSEIDLENSVWEIPAEKMKGRDADSHIVPLSKQMIEIIQSLPVLSEKWTFVGRIHGTHVSAKQLLKSSREFSGDDRITLHGFRSNFATWCDEMTEYDDRLSETALAHKVGSAVSRAYKRGNRLEKRRQMMQDWADFLVGG